MGRDSEFKEEAPKPSAEGLKLPGSFHKGRQGYYEDHHSGSRWIGGCTKCAKEEKAGTHPLMS